MSEATLFLHVGDDKFDLWDAVQGATLGDLEDLQEWTARKGFDGVTVESLDGLMSHLDKVVDGLVPDDADELPKEKQEEINKAVGLALLSDRELLRNMPGAIWLCWRRAGIDKTFDDARSVPAMNAQIRVEQELPKDLSSAGDDVAA